MLECAEQRRLPAPARVAVSMSGLAALGNEGAIALAAALVGAGTVRELRFWNDDEALWPPMTATEALAEIQKLMRRLRVLLAALPALQRLDVVCLSKMSAHIPVSSYGLAHAPPAC